MPKTYNPLIAVLLGGFLLGLLSAAEDSTCKPVWDQAIGNKKADIILQQGEPTKTSFIEPKDMLDELRAFVKGKAPVGTKFVLQMSYNKDKATLYYWLAKNAKTEDWNVFSDVKIPGEVKF